MIHAIDPSDKSKTEEGKGKWRSFDRLYKLAFLSQFWHNKNPIKDYEINSSEIHPPEFNTYKDILWLHVGSKVYSQLDRERLQILHRLFDNNQPAWDRCTKAEKLSFITQFSVQGIPIDTYVDEFGFCDEIWSNFGDISKLLDQTGIKVIHNFLKTRKGNEKWKTISPSLQLHLLSTFHKENLPCTLFLNLERLNNEDIKNYPDFIWVICNSQDNTRLDRDRFKIEVTSLFERCFTLDYPPPSHKILVPYQTFDLSKLEKFFTFEIDNCISKGTLTKNQLSWLGAIGLSNRVSSVFNKLSPQNHDELIKKLKSQFGMFYSLNQ